MIKFDLFGTQTEEKAAQQKAEQTTINLFGEQPVPIVPQQVVEQTVEVKSTEEAPVVPIKTIEIKTNDKPKTKSKAKAKTDSKAASALTEKLKEQKAKKENVVITPEWTIAYSANQYHIPHNMNVEEVRQWMELDYPELSKERTSWDINEEKRLLVPIVSGAKKG